MSYKFFLTLKAEQEIYESGDWYEEQQEGLGYRFEKGVLEKIKTIIKNPLHYPFKGKWREAGLDKFPFLITYRIDEENKTLIILSVFHTSRHHKKKKS